MRRSMAKLKAIERLAGQSVMLEETCLDDYITTPNYSKSKSNRITELKELIVKLKKNCLNIEKLPLQLLHSELMRSFPYPLIDPSFLSMGSSKKYGKKGEILLPKFSVYKRSADGFYPFNIILSETMGGRRSFFGFVGVYSELKENYGGSGLGISVHLNKILTEELVKSVEFYKRGNKRRNNTFISRSDSEVYWGIPKKLSEKYGKIGKGREITYRSRFAGILPDSSRNKLIEADAIFGKEVYLIAETKPSQWEISKPKPRIIKDPLLVGISNEKCYLVDYFDTTPMENYVRKEFTSGKL